MTDVNLDRRAARRAQRARRRCRGRAAAARWLWIAVPALLLACGKSNKHPPGQVPLEPIDAASARIDVRTLSGLDPGDLARLLEPDAEVAAFAARAVQGAAN